VETQKERKDRTARGREDKKKIGGEDMNPGEAQNTCFHNRIRMFSQMQAAPNHMHAILLRHKVKETKDKGAHARH
jgi:hypothetical protein